MSWIIYKIKGQLKAGPLQRASLGVCDLPMLPIYLKTIDILSTFVLEGLVL